MVKFTPAQEKSIIDTRNEWLSIAQSGKDITIKDVEQGVIDLYTLDNRKKPLILILNDPLQCQCLANVLKNKGSQLYSQLGSQLYSQLDSQLYSQLYSQLRSQLDSQFRTQLDSQLRTQKLEWFSMLGGLSWRSSYYSVFDFVLKHDLLKLDKKLEEITNQQISFLKTGVWDLIVFDELCIICKTPITKRDDRNRLHSLTGKACEFRSGYGFYAIHGVVFDEKLWNKVKDRKLTPKQLFSMKNTDQRFVAMNHYGFENLIDKIDKSLINKSEYGNELYSTKFDNVELKLLIYPDIDTPEKRRVSFVNPILETARDAMAWKHNCTEEEYNKMQVLKTWC